MNGEVGMASPVIYVSRPGVYRCTVHASERIGQSCLSKSIHVGEGNF